MFSILHLAAILLIMGHAELITVKTPQKHINVTAGENALLQCNFVTIAETSGLTIQWDFISMSSMMPNQIYYYQSGKVVIADSYKSRIHPPSTPATSRNASILIENMQPSDTGMYTCEVHNIPDVEGQSEANIIVNVFEKPSTPYCAVHGDVESGHLVTLTCHSEHGSPKPTYTWTRLDQTKSRRPVLGHVTENGILEIKNISQFQFGEYQCNAANVAGFSSCKIELNAEAGDGVIAGAVIGALLGCVLIILAVWFIAHMLKKHKYKAVKASEAETKRSTSQTGGASESVAMATRPSNLQAEDEPQA
ncbi:V-set and immunoglobulin domain-containing protein 1-like [Thalassophryne amazonica]|uniref:V-set and immunoglobulin domain-containing protein 1-like n=1 Tax=Thalassophryne amazonica TaxID=390379 RepID=UPI001471940E|nr:V-set and immunoglobulin domain-containing protein 1-like [Thalassophryne amazonica]